MQTELLEKHMVTIVVDQSLINSSMYEHTCVENIIKLFKSTGKCDYQQQYKAIIEASMVYTTDIFTDNSPLSSRQSVTVKIQVQENHSFRF